MAFTMQQQLKKLVITISGGFLALIGIIFILVPGPAFLFLPIGLAILSLEYEVAKIWLKKCQIWMRKGAVRMDALVTFCRRKLKK
jgi:putative transmembrane protein PGPGW